MEPLDPATVLDVAARWIWYPDDTAVIDTADYLLLGFRPYLPSPTQVLRTASDRPPGDLVAEVRAHLAAWQRPSAAWWVHDATRPERLEQALLDAGAVRDETVSVLARPLDPLDSLPPRDSAVEVREVRDLATLRDLDAVQVAAFGGTLTPEDDLPGRLTTLVEQRAAATGLQVVGYLDGAPVSAGGVSVADGYGRLWGGATIPRARRRGSYGALLRARMAWAAEQGAHAALSKGRVETSAPILRAAGFAAYGEERSYVLATSP